MCGIAGIINLNESLSKSSSLISMTKSMVNRGPDDEGYMLFDEQPLPFIGDDTICKNHAHINTTYNQPFKIGLGFRQLKIIDLSNNSHQPMCDVDKRYWIIFNGEVYNFKEIKTELINLGYSFFSNSDTEVVLNAYKQWSEKALDKFNGMFALAIYDNVKNEIFIARDRIGIKPIYYSYDKNHFVFASTIKSIIDSQLIEPKINWNGLWQNFRFSIAQRPNTCIENIIALEPAHFLKINLKSNAVRKTRYWEIPVNNQDLTLTEEKSIKLIEENLYNAIKYRLNADVEVGVFMSGGIDSTTIAVIASKLNPSIKVLTLGLKGYNNYDEISQAEDTANLHQLNHYISNVNPLEIIDNINQIILAYEEPYHNLSANYILAKIASENKLKVILNGLGGDELFGGYDVYKKLSLWKYLQKNRTIVKILPKIHQKIKKGIQLSNYNNIGEYYSHYYTTFNDQEIGNLFKTKKYNTKHTISELYENKMSFTDDFEAISFYNLKSYISNHQMRAVDQSTMSFSIEGRFPLLDHNFIETAFKIPTRHKIKGNTQKYILRQVAKKHIAPSCLTMNKKGLGLPLEHWINNELRELTFDSIQKLKHRSLFDNNQIDTILKSKDANKIWQLVTTELWIQKFLSN